MLINDTIPAINNRINEFVCDQLCFVTFGMSA